MLKPGPLNLITDVPGFVVGNAQDDTVKTGVSVLSRGAPFTAGVFVMGGAPGTRETDLLAPDKTVQQVDALVLSGGSAFGLDSASGVADALKEQGKGFVVGDANVPIVPAAILFDLLNGGQKTWAQNPYKALGRAALANSVRDFDIGSFGAGTGATTADLKGGLGSASAVLPCGATVGALVAVNAIGSAVVNGGPAFWAAPFELENEFGGQNHPSAYGDPHSPVTKLGPAKNTSIGIVATDADLSQAQCTRLAVAAHDGLARGLLPSHTPMDGDLLFAASSGQKPLEDEVLLGHVAGLCVARAVARGVYAAGSLDSDLVPSWSDRFGQHKA